MPVLTVNTGSATVKLALWAERAGATDDAPLARAKLEGAALDDPAAGLRAFTSGRTIAAAAHRVVHGGSRRQPALVDDTLLAELEALVPLAPNHNPRAIAWLRATAAALPGVPSLAVFDTALFADLPAAAATYALPRDLARKHGLRRYGFHGLAHESMWRAWLALGKPASAKVVTLQLGSGCSAAALDGGKPVDVSMGMTPLEGLVMGTRAGDVDPGLLLHLLRGGIVDVAGLERMLSAESGLRGVSGLSGDVRELLGAAATGNADARLALDVWTHRARRYLGAFLGVLGGADAVLVGGGIGQNATALRADLLGGFAFAGLALDAGANDRATPEDGGAPLPVHAAGSRVECWVVPVDEERLLRDEARALLAHTG